MMRREGWNFPGEDYPPPESVTIAGKEVSRADAFDLILDGKTARVEVIHQDFENRIYLVVTADEDPAMEQMMMDDRILPGHHFFFFPEEVEPLED
ncbi:MAG: hypothetical protein E6I93_17120 [Chloroflexi bacterium]|nr:MAG: hypothetical protein E6I93_17120 [Chloroflexota bacterium]